MPFKKLFIAALALSIATPAIVQPAEAAGTSFKDVPSSYYAYTEITDLVNRGVIKGFADNTFKPAKQVTRAEFATFVARALVLPAASSNFKDVPKNSSLYDGVSRAYKAGIIKGFADGTFKGTLPVTREDMAVMIDRALQKKGSFTKTKALNFSDSTIIGGYAKLSVQRLYYYGIMGAYTGTKFSGKVAGTRAETARFLFRMFKVIENGTYTGPSTPAPTQDIEAIKKKDPLKLTRSEIVAAYGPYTILMRYDIFGKVRGIVEWDYWDQYLYYIADAKEYNYQNVQRPDEWLKQEKERGSLSNLYGEVDTSYPNYEIIALNGVPFIHSELYTLGHNSLIYNQIIKKHGPIIPTPPTESGLFKIDIHYKKNDFVTYYKDSVKVGKQIALPYSKDNKSLMVDVKSVFSNTPQVKLTSSSISHGDITLTYTNGSKQVKVNGEIKTLSVSPEIKNGAQMLPIREVSELIGLETRVLVYGAVQRIEILNYTEAFSDSYK